MKFRKWTLILAAIAMLMVSGIGAVLAAPSAQSAPDENDSSASGTAPEVAPQAYLGAAVLPLTDHIRKALGLPENLEGVVVQGTAPDSPAREADIRRGDVLHSADGHVLTTPAELRRILASKSPGDTLELVVVNEDGRRAVSVVLAARPRPDHPNPNHFPKWLQRLYQFVHTFPNAVDAELRLMNDENQVVTYNATLGSVLRAGEGALVIEMRTGEEAKSEVPNDAVVIKKFQRVELTDLEQGDRVVVLEQDGVVKAVVAGPFQRPRPRPVPYPRPHDMDQDGGTGPVTPRPGNWEDVPDELKERFEEFRNQINEAIQGRFGELRERLGNNVLPQLQDRLEGIQQHIRGLNGRVERLEHAVPPTTGNVS